MLRVIKKLKERSSLSSKLLFWVRIPILRNIKKITRDISIVIIDEMLPVIAGEKLADYIDVFCETGFFSPEEMETICKAGCFPWIETEIACEPTEQYWWN